MAISQNLVHQLENRPTRKLFATSGNTFPQLAAFHILSGRYPKTWSKLFWTVSQAEDSANFSVPSQPKDCSKHMLPFVKVVVLGPIYNFSFWYFDVLLKNLKLAPFKPGVDLGLRASGALECAPRAELPTGSLLRPALSVIFGGPLADAVTNNKTSSAHQFPRPHATRCANAEPLPRAAQHWSASRLATGQLAAWAGQLSTSWQAPPKLSSNGHTHTKLLSWSPLEPPPPSCLHCPPLVLCHGAPHVAPLHYPLSTPLPPQDPPAPSLPPQLTTSLEQKQRWNFIVGRFSAPNQAPKWNPRWSLVPPHHFPDQARSSPHRNRAPSTGHGARDSIAIGVLVVGTYQWEPGTCLREPNFQI
jgi:hypothetical protein